LKDVPHNCKEWAMRDAQANIKSCFTNKLRGNISKFKTPFRSKKNPRQVLTIRSQNISKDLKIYPPLLFKKDIYNKKQKYIQNMKKFDLTLPIKEIPSSYGKSQQMNGIYVSQQKEKKTNIKQTMRIELFP